MDIIAAIEFYCKQNDPLAEWSCGEQYKDLVWHKGALPKPTKEQIKDAWDQLVIFRQKKRIYETQKS